MATEFVGIELELRGEEGVYNDLRKIQSIMNSLGGRKKIDAGLQEAHRQVVAYRGELEKLQREQKELKSVAKEAGDAFVQAQNKMSDALANVNNRYKGSMSDRRKAVYEAAKQVEASKQAYDDATQAVIRHQEAIEATTLAKKDGEQAERVFRQGIRESGKTFNQTATAITSRVRQMGGSMQSLGNSLQKLTSPFTRLASGFVMGAGYKALNTMTEGLSKGFTRYDTMKKYPKIMNAFGYSAEEAQKSIDALDQSVRGLPTGLDEMVDMSQRFTATTGDIKKGTDLAIAANNAFLASMSTDTQKYQGMMQLQDVLGGKDMNAREWNSLVSSMTPAIVKMGESLGYTSSNMDEWIQKVRDGKVANEDFIDTLIKVGTEGGEVAKMAENSKDTWQAFFANVGNAASRMTAGVIKALDTLTQSMFGKDLNQFMSENVISAIDNMAKSVQNWIKANPDKIIDFFDSLKSIDFVGFGKGLLEGYGAMVKVIQGLSNLFGDKSLKWLGNAMVWGNLLGRFLTVFGGLTRGLAPLIGKLGALGLNLGKIAELFGGLGGAKGAKDAVETAGSLGKASAGMVALAKNIGLAAASIAAIGGAGFVAFRSFKTIVKDLHDAIREINSFSTGELQQADQVLFGMATALTGFVVAADAIGIAVGSLGSIGTFPAVIGGAVMAIVGAMAALVSAETMAIFKSFEQSTKSLKQGLKNVEELGNIKFNKDKVETALGTMKQIMETFDASYDEGGSAKEGGKTHADWSANAAKFSVITDNISKGVKGIKDTMAELDTLPDITDAEVTSATEKVTNVIEAMKKISKELNMKFDTGLLDFLGGGTVITKGTTARAGSVIDNIKGIITTVKDTVAELKSLETLDVELDTAVGNVKDIGTKMGEIFTALNDAFGQEFITDSDGSFVQKTNEGVTKKQTKKAEALKTLFDSYKQSIEAIRGIYESLVGKEGDMSLDLGKFNEVMSNISGEDGIIAQLKGMYDGLISEESGFGQGGDVDLAGIMESFATAIGSVKQAVTTLSEIGQIEFEGDDGMTGIVTSINEMVSGLTTSFSEDAITPLTEQIALFKQSMEQIKLSLQDMATIGEEVDIASISSQISGMVTGVTNAFNAEAIAGLTAQVEAFRLQIETIKTTIQSLGEGGIEVNIEIIPNITGDDTTVNELNDAHDAIKTARDAIKKLSESINLSFPISVSLPGLEGAISKMYSAASRLRAARSALSAAGYATGGMIAPSGAKYYAKGGNIRSGGFPGRPMGTDTVPIWATPGEWMMRKKAVDLFGTEFMRRVNNLDVKGAMNALMAKAGSMANVGRQTVINNTYNNNQKVVQNINTNSPDFAYRSASRFVGAF